MTISSSGLSSMLAFWPTGDRSVDLFLAAVVALVAGCS